MYKLLRRLFLGGTELRDYERASIDALRENLSPEARNLFDRQFTLFDHVQRFSQEKLVVFHFGEAYNDPRVPLFPNRREELSVATLNVRSTLQNASIRCTIVFHQGRLSSL